MNTAKRNFKRFCRIISPALFILPAVILGVLAMIRSGVSPALWGQQIAAWVVFALFIWPMQRVFRRISSGVVGISLLIVLAAALFGEEAGGARRWIDLGIFHVNAAQLVLPALLVVLCRAQYPYPVLLIAAVVLCMQPSLAQLSAFSAAAIVILWRKKNNLWSMGSAFLLAVLALWCAHKPVEIEPVAYCEGVLSMLGEIAWPLQAAGWAALAAVPVCWWLWNRGNVHALSVAVYYAVSLLFAFTGEYPVLFMGFGLSPIVGYGLACACIHAYAHSGMDS